MLWLFIILTAYFLLAITSILDKHLLLGRLSPEVYSFYIGFLGILSLLLIPFIDFSIPNLFHLILCLSAGFLFVVALFALYTGLKYFETSRIIPAIGGVLPIFTFILVSFFEQKQELEPLRVLAFFFLVLGSVLISFKKEKAITIKSFLVSVLASFLFALSFILTKMVYVSQSFWSGFILMRMGGFLATLCLAFTPQVKKQVFTKKQGIKQKTGAIFFFNQIIGGIAFILQNWAIALVPFSSLVFISALESTKYIFLFIMTILISSKFPTFLKEEISKKAITQKLLSILCIIIGLIVLSFL